MIDFSRSGEGGPVDYVGRGTAPSHRGMKISENDWSRFSGRLNAILDAFGVPQPERDQVVACV